MPFLWYACIILSISGLHIFASPKISYSLQDILDIAKQKGTRLKIIETTAQFQRQQVQIYRSQAFPRINFSTGVGYASQTLQAEISLSDDLSAIFDRINGFMVNWSLSIEQPIFKFGQIINSIRLASLSEKLTSKNRDLQRDTYFLQVIEQFTQAYIDQFDYVIAEQSQDRSQRRFQRTTIDFEANRISKRDQLRSQALFEGDRAELISSRSNRDLSIRNLNTLVGISENVEYLLVLDTGGPFFQTPTDIKDQNPEVSIKRLETEINRNLRRNAWAAFFPSLSLTGSLVNEFMVVDTSGMAEKFQQFEGGEAIPFAEIPVNVDYFNPDFINYSLGVQLTWNLFDGKQSYAQYSQAKSQEEISHLELEQLERETISNIREIKDRITAIDNAISAYGLQFEASVKAMEQAEMDFQDGFIDAVSFLDIEKEYRDAARSFDNAKLQRILLQAQLRITMGLGVYGE